MATIVYLDVEDEITTAAARIRSAGEARVGMVVPFGSRVATSRINFRLLAREALDAGRRLDVIAPDASARALAASAGLPVFASVAEYEAALATGGPVDDGEAAAAQRGVRDDARGVRGATAAGTAAGAATGPAATSPTELVVAPSQPGVPGEEAISAPSRSAAASAPVVRDAPVAPEARRRRGLRRPLVVVVLVLALVVGFGVTAAALALPKADITVTPVLEPVEPVSFTVRADTGATAVDPVAMTIPATSVQVPVTASGEFPATGTSVQQSSATGQVTFDSINTVNAMPIPRGTRVSTLDGVTFATTQSTTVPRATVSGSTISHGFATVGVGAIAPGPKGNVATGAINQVPSSLAALQISVSNAAPTTGGSRDEFPKIQATDVTAATDKLAKDLETQMAAAVGDSTIAPPGTTLFPDTASLGAPTYTPDVAGLPGKVLKVGQTTFQLQADATATVTAVDESPLKAMGETALRAAVKPGYEIVEDSIEVSVSEGQVGEDGTVSYTVSASALQHRPVDAAALKAAVLGKSEAEAKAALAPYGTVELVLWPFWVSSVPTNGDRVAITVATPVAPAATPTPKPSTTPRPTRAAASSRPSSPAAGSSPSASSASSPGASASPSGASPVPSG